MNHHNYLKKAVKLESIHKAYTLQRNRVNLLIRNTERKFCIESIDSNKQNPNISKPIGLLRRVNKSYMYS